jgi:MFS superfamily sulfate permease-like transporter
MPCTSAEGRSSVGRGTEGTNRVAAVLNAFFVQMIALLTLPVLVFVPMPAVATMAFIGSLYLLENVAKQYSWRQIDTSFVTFGLTLTVSVACDPLVGTVSGTVFSLFSMLGKMMEGPVIIKVYECCSSQREMMSPCSAGNVNYETIAEFVNVAALDATDLASSSNPFSTNNRNAIEYEEIDKSSSAVYFSAVARSGYKGNMAAAGSIHGDSLPLLTGPHSGSGYVSSPPKWATTTSSDFVLVYAFKDQLSQLNGSAHIQRVKRLTKRLDHISTIVFSLHDVGFLDHDGIEALRAMFALCDKEAVRCFLEVSDYGGENVEADAFSRQLRQQNKVVSHWSDSIRCTTPVKDNNRSFVMVPVNGLLQNQIV